jgi:3-oxoacyl-[acyl-carrier protein] reductase
MATASYPLSSITGHRGRRHAHRVRRRIDHDRGAVALQCSLTERNLAMPADALAGKIALVTGSSKGIGAAIAQRLARDGATVVVNYAGAAAPAQDVVARIQAAGGAAEAAQADVSDEASVRRMVAGLMSRHGRVDILVNNAGTYAAAPLAEVTAEHFHRLFDLNVKGPLLVTAAAIAANAFPPTGGGRIICVSSIAARGAAANTSVYAASKAAVEALVRNWAAELGPRGITVNAVAPGTTFTEAVSASAAESWKQDLLAHTPLGRLGAPADVADAVALLASPDAHWLTGQVVDASGGYRP